MKLTLEPQEVMNFFQTINQIPRESGNEKGISDFLVQFAKDRNLEVKQDSEYNVIIRKGATKGYEDRPPFIIQGHIDMVCEKTHDSNHDFSKDPIEHVQKGEWLYANNTTLGADNGIAVAMALAILDSNTIPHGPMECLFTTNEETGMEGAMAVKGKDLHGKYLINLDAEVEGEFIVSCAGGCRLELDVPLLHDRVDPKFTHALTLSMTGMKGGHSGIEINKQFGNANQIMARLIYTLSDSFEFQLAHFEGGTKHNAIPRTATATIVVAESSLAAIKTSLQAHMKHIHSEYAVQDGDMALDIKDAPLPEKVYAPSTTEALLAFLYIAPHGVFGMSQTLPGLVETSNNLAIVRETEHSIHMLVSIRSSNANLIDFLKNKLSFLAEKLGISCVEQGRYPAWEYERGSHLEEQGIAAFKTVMGHEPTVSAVHAGLECGLLKGELPNTEMLSFGPTILGAHTPQERVHLPSVERTYKVVLELLKNLK